MVFKIYVDTNVYLDFFLERDSRFVPHSTFAEQVFSAAYQKKIVLVVSDWVKTQIKQEIGERWGQCKGLFEDLKARCVLEEIKVSSEIKREANKYPTEHEDAVHALLAIKAGAKVLVTRNLKDFELFGDKIKIISPSDFEA